MELRMGLTSGKMKAVDVCLGFADWSQSVWLDSKETCQREGACQCDSDPEQQRKGACQCDRTQSNRGKGACRCDQTQRTKGREAYPCGGDPEQQREGKGGLRDKEVQSTGF